MKKHNNITPAAEVEDVKDKGFSLIELLVVIVVIGVLSSVAAVGASALQGRATTTACAQDLRNVETALSLAASDGVTITTGADLVPDYMDTESTLHIYDAVLGVQPAGRCA